MISDVLFYLGAILLFSCGTIHLTLTKSIIKGFNQSSEEIKQIFRLEWIIEGLTLYFMGVFVFIITALGLSHEFVSKIIFWISSMMLFIMMVLSLVTGGKSSTSNLIKSSWIRKVTKMHFKICPLIKFTSGILLLLGNLL